jgi:large conductance mechanosensitive channel
VDFLIVALAIFLVIRQINLLKKAPPPAEPTTKDCPECCSAIPIKAIRCPHCTSSLVAAK